MLDNIANSFLYKEDNVIGSIRSIQIHHIK